MREAEFPLQLGDGFAGLVGLEGLDVWRNQGHVVDDVVTQKDTGNGGKTQRQKAGRTSPRPTARVVVSDGAAVAAQPGVLYVESLTCLLPAFSNILKGA